MSWRRSMISSGPITSTRPPITGIGISSAWCPTSSMIRASQRPAKTLLQRVRAPALVATPVRDSEPPVRRGCEAPGLVGQPVGQEVARHVGARAVGVGHRRADAGCLGEGDELHGHCARDQVRCGRQVRQHGDREVRSG